MSTKAPRPLIFFYGFISTFLVLNLTLFTYFYACGKKQWLVELIQVKLFRVPIIVYIGVISATVGLLIMIFAYLSYSMQYGKMEEKIRLLSMGNYDAPIFKRDVPKSQSGDSSFASETDIYIEEIRRKMLELSKDLQAVSVKPELVDGESKEEILENERHRLARELHDSVSQELFAAMMMLSALNEQVDAKGIDPGFKKHLNLVEEIVNNAQSEMRALLLHLRPINLEGKSLKSGIEQLLIELKTKIHIQLSWEVENVHLPSGIEDHLFRIVQELVSNTLRHSKASELEVYLTQVDQNVLLKMIDDGVGFDVNDKKVGSYGLKNIEERVAGMGGTLKIISIPGNGTSVEIKIPVIRSEVSSD